MKFIIPMLCALLAGCAFVEKIDPYMRCPEYCKKCHPVSIYGEPSWKILQGICDESCQICENRRIQSETPTWNERKETTLARMENKFNLPSEVELFLHEAMPIVEKERAILLKKYAKLRKIYNNLDLTKSKTYSTPSRKICEIKRESVFSDLMAFAEKLCELNSDIEKVYIKYQTTTDKSDNLNELIDEIDKISAKISRINEEIK